MKIGNEIASLLISKNSTIAGITIEINYDFRQLKLIKTEIGEVLTPTICKMNSQIEGKVILTAISTDEIKSEGAVLHLEYNYWRCKWRWSSEYKSCHIQIN